MRLKAAKIENYSGYTLNWRGKIAPLRTGHYFIEKGKSVGGDAPKDFIRVYEYGSGLKRSPKAWPAYISKVGHKWYPIESITEYLLNRIGETLGLKMAKSSLMAAREQIRFLSRYFLADHEQLVHGAQLFAGYMADEEFVEEIEQKGMARDFFTFQFVEESIKHQFPNHALMLLKAFTQLLLFDAITGNNDRHFYNWGIISDIRGASPPRFAPIYDTARGLFWNIKEDKVVELVTIQHQLHDFLNKYINHSYPKTGWEGEININHFKLIELIYQNDKRYCDVCHDFLSKEKLQAIISLLHNEFETLLSKERRDLIERCLTTRYERLLQVLK